MMSSTAGCWARPVGAGGPGRAVGTPAPRDRVRVAIDATASGEGGVLRAGSTSQRGCHCKGSARPRLGVPARRRHRHLRTAGRRSSTSADRPAPHRRRSQAGRGAPAARQGGPLLVFNAATAPPRRLRGLPATSGRLPPAALLHQRGRLAGKNGRPPPGTGSHCWRRGHRGRGAGRGGRALPNRADEASSARHRSTAPSGRGWHGVTSSTAAAAGSRAAILPSARYLVTSRRPPADGATRTAAVALARQPGRCLDELGAPTSQVRHRALDPHLKGTSASPREGRMPAGDRGPDESRVRDYGVGMAVETEVWATVITDLVAELDALFAAVPERGWESPAANVGWSCWRTADHISGDFAHYAAQIVGQPRDHYVKFSFDTSRATTPDELREVVRVAGGILAAAVRTASPDWLAWHPHGYFTAAGFAAIGAAEGLVHGHDIAAGLGRPGPPARSYAGRCSAQCSRTLGTGPDRRH